MFFPTRRESGLSVDSRETDSISKGKQKMTRTLTLLLLFLGTFVASAPAETSNPLQPTVAAVNDDIRGTADGIVRVHHSGNARLRGELRSDTGALIGTIFAQMNADGTVIAITSTSSGHIALTGTWDPLGLSIGTTIGNVGIELEGIFSGESWSGEWRVRRD